VAHQTAPPSKIEKHAGSHGPGRYFVVWILLLAFTATTVKTGRTDLGWVNLPLALTIATIKATLVVLFFMHLSEAPGTNRLVFVVSLVFLILMMLGVFGDLLTRNQMSLPQNAPPVGGPEIAVPGEGPGERR
jgi:cytochrome c oxidase subunit 4